VSASGVFRIEIDGRPPRVADLQRLALDHTGHFTAMQVRGARVRGLGNHLDRLDEGSRELFGVPLDGERVRELARHALAEDVRDASLRVIVFAAQQGALSVMVTLRPPGPMPEGPLALHAVEYQRTLAHVKHLDGFGQSHRARLARREGFDDVMLTAADGTIAETSIANVGLVRGGEVVWPEAPSLLGITKQLLEPRLADAGLPSRRAQVRVAQLPSYDAAFVTNSRGIAPVGRIDDVRFAVGKDVMATLAEVYAGVPWDAFADA
jgi:branched-subunit amino acid aminotransferase/4-amino-4-deoxychorismate lyase